MPPNNALHEALSPRRRPPCASVAEIVAFIAGNPSSLMEKDKYGRTPIYSAIIVNHNYASLEVVQALIDACPAAILEYDDRGDLPLHRVLGDGSFEYARALIDGNPACLQLCGSKGELPMHVAVQRRGVGTIFNLILEGYPEACEMCNGDGLVPLECALRCHYDPDFEVIEALVRVFPEALKIKDSTRGTFPLHQICDLYPLTETFISNVQATCPEAFLACDNCGHLPLHYAMRRLEVEGEARQTSAIAMIRACPESASVAAEDGRLPLHSSIGQLTPRVTHALANAYPEAVVTNAGYFGETPLHVMLEDPEKCSLEVAKVLVAARPDALMIKDEQGNIPLQTAVRRRAVFSILVWLTNAWPESVKVTNDAGEIPLHIAAWNESASALELIRMLYSAWPDGVKQADSQGMLPLATAVNYGSQGAALFLLEAYPEAARAKDNRGRLPLHHAVHAGSLDTVTALVTACSNCVKEPTPEGELPLFLAFNRRDFSEGIVKLLLEAWPDSIKCTNQVGDLPIHVVSRLVGGISRELSDVCASAKYLIDSWPEALLQKNAAGDIPLHILLSCIKHAEQLGRKRKRADVVNSQLELVRLFVSTCRESVEVVDGDGSIPLIVASQNDYVSLDVIDFLVRASMNVLPTSRTGRFPASEE